mgnify:FL=1
MARKPPTEPIRPDSQDAVFVGGLFAMMMEYQKQLHKEAREDGKAARRAKGLAMQAKAAKNALEIAKIEQMMAEAKEMADRVREAALIAILNGEVSAGSAFTVTLPKGAGKKSDQIQRQIVQMEAESQQADAGAEEARTDADHSRDHTQAIADAIRKYLDMLGATKPPT